MRRFTKHEPSKLALLWQKIKTSGKNTWRKVLCKNISPPPKKEDKGMWVKSSQTHLWRTIAPAFNKHGWAWIGPEEDKEKASKPWETNKRTVTPLAGSIYARWASEQPPI